MTRVPSRPISTTKRPRWRKPKPRSIKPGLTTSDTSRSGSGDIARRRRRTKAAYEEAASLNAAEAALETSRLNLEWTDVRAPISGRISRIDVTVGNLVNGGSGQATHPHHDRIDRSALYLHQCASGHRPALPAVGSEEKKTNVAGAKVPCFLKLEDETQYVTRA